MKGEASERIQERREKLRELWWGNQGLDLEEGTMALAVELAGESPQGGAKAEVAEGSGGGSGIDQDLLLLLNKYLNQANLIRTIGNQEGGLGL